MPEPLFADFEDTIVRPSSDRTPEQPVAVPDVPEVAEGEFVLEAPSVEAALADVRDRTGREPEVLEIETVTRGGIGGFFAREVVRVRVRVGGNPTDQPALRPLLERTTPEARVAEARPLGVDGVLAALASANDDQERSFEAELRAALSEGRPVRPADLTPAPVEPLVARPPEQQPAARAPRVAQPAAPAAAQAPTVVAPEPVAPAPAQPRSTPIAEAPAPAAPPTVAASEASAASAPVAPSPNATVAQPAPAAASAPIVEAAPQAAIDVVAEVDPEPEVVEVVAEADTEHEVVEARPLISEEVRARLHGEVVAEQVVDTAAVADAPSAPKIKMSSRVAQRAAEAEVASATPTMAASAPAPSAPVEATAATSLVATTPRATAQVKERGRRLAPGAPIAASRALRPGHRWTSRALYAIGLPASVIDRLDVPIGADEFMWLRAMAEAVAPWCRPLPGGSSVLIGPEADALGQAMDLPTCHLGDRPPYGGDVALAADDSVSGRAWIEEVRGDRWVHLVAGGDRWEGLLAAEPRVVSLVGRGGIASALSLCAEFDLVLGHLMDHPASGRAIRLTPLDVATAVRDLLPRTEVR